MDNFCPCFLQNLEDKISRCEYIEEKKIYQHFFKNFLNTFPLDSIEAVLIDTLHKGN